MPKPTPPQQPESFKNRLERLLGISAPTGPTVVEKKKRISRHEQEVKRERIIKTGIAIAAAAVILVLAYGALNTYVLIPNKTLATVNGVKITRKDYWKGRTVDLVDQARQYEQFASFVPPDQAQQYLSMAQSAVDSIPDVWGSTDVDQATLDRLVEDQVILQNAEALDVSVTPEEAKQWALNEFSELDAPLITPTPSPTLIPERAAMATETAVANALGDLEAGLVPTSEPLLAPPVVAAEGTPLPTVAPPTPTATVDPAAAVATAQANLDAFASGVLASGKLNIDDYIAYRAVPALTRQRVDEALNADVGQTAPMVRARHILVPTEEEANAIAADLAKGADFATLAKEQSTDQGTGANGGELGWFIAEEMVPPFSAAAFALEPGGISAPVQSEFGWHIIEVEEKADARPLTDAQINRIRQANYDTWVADQRAARTISGIATATEVPTGDTFIPPADAPPAPTPTAFPTDTPVLPDGTPGN